MMNSASDLRLWSGKSQALTLWLKEMKKRLCDTDFFFLLARKNPFFFFFTCPKPIKVKRQGKKHFRHFRLEESRGGSNTASGCAVGNCLLAVLMMKARLDGGFFGDSINNFFFLWLFKNLLDKTNIQLNKVD